TDNAPTGLGVNDLITYTIVVNNTGNVTVSDITLSDTLTDLDGNVLSLLSNPTLTGSSSGSSAASLLVGGSLTYTATYVLDQEDIDAGGVSNTVTATGDSPSGTDDVSDVSDDGDELVDGPDADTDPTNDPTVTTVTPTAALTVVKTAVITDNAPTGLGVNDLITYT
ncbi:DUF7507 domain-containing protein, partial [Winogradskyella eximia]|uniref:DUF7507 domain-containing protein n=1 Tax=Winogradskyella eximia TaxID=262006 RepID=UPI002492E6F2